MLTFGIWSGRVIRNNQLDTAHSMTLWFQKHMNMKRRYSIFLKACTFFLSITYAWPDFLEIKQLSTEKVFKKNVKLIEMFYYKFAIMCLSIHVILSFWSIQFWVYQRSHILSFIPCSFVLQMYQLCRWHTFISGLQYANIKHLAKNWCWWRKYSDSGTVVTFRW